MDTMKPFQAAILVFCGFFFGMLVFAEMPALFPNPSWWSAAASMVMVPVTIILAWLVAHLPEKFRESAADIENMRFTKAVLIEYRTTVRDMNNICNKLPQTDLNKWIGMTIRMSDLYETTRSGAARHGSFLDLELVRRRAMHFHFFLIMQKQHLAERKLNIRQPTGSSPWQAWKT